MHLDSIDLRILDELQRDASRSVEQIAQAVGLSQNPCWRRIKRLEHDLEKEEKKLMKKVKEAAKVAKMAAGG